VFHGCGNPTKIQPGFKLHHSTNPLPHPEWETRGTSVRVENSFYRRSALISSSSFAITVCI
jgi:hypothetical protein